MMDAAAFVRAQIDALRAAHPDLLDDEETAAIVLEGETGFLEVLDRLLFAIILAEGLAEGVKTRIATMQGRKVRYEERAERLRTVVETLMTEAGQTKVTLPAATLSMRTNPPRVVIIDEAGIPEQFIRVKREPDKAAIREALKAGVEIEGAALSNQPPSLQIRT